MDQSDAEKEKETHFIVNEDNGRTPSFCGDCNMKYMKGQVAGKE